MKEVGNYGCSDVNNMFINSHKNEYPEKLKEMEDQNIDKLRQDIMHDGIVCFIKKRESF